MSLADELLADLEEPEEDDFILDNPDLNLNIENKTSSKDGKFFWIC